jgi:arylsulfatase A-like enzyme
VFTSDHGDYLGAHGLFLKGVAPFEEVYRVPLVLRGPGVAPRTVVAEPTSLLDLGRTLTRLLLGEDFGGHGRDLSPLLAGGATEAGEGVGDAADAGEAETGEPERGRPQAFAEFHGQRLGYTQRIVWRGHHKYVFNGFDRDELYDLRADPHELVNLAGRPEHGSLLAEMATAMWREVRRTGDDTLGDAQYGMFRFAPVGPESVTQGEDRDG